MSTPEGDQSATTAGKELASAAELQVGMRLEAMDQYGKWYIAKVLEMEKEKEEEEECKEVLIHFEGWSYRHDEYVELGKGRLRCLSPSRLELLLKEREKARRVFAVGDRVQAKWDDGRMYLGKVLKVLKEEVKVLFDDGIEYTAPVMSVRKRRMDKPTTASFFEGALTSPSSPSCLLLDNNHQERARKRHRSEEDSQSSQASPSPVSSPIFRPKSKKLRHRVARLASDSSGSDSDHETPHHHRYKSSPSSHKEPPPPSSSLQPHTPLLSATQMKEGEDVSGENSRQPSSPTQQPSSPASSDSDHSKPRRKKYQTLRDPYPLRRLPQSTPSKPPVEAHSTPNLKVDGGSSLSTKDAVLLTPPSEMGKGVNPKRTAVSAVKETSAVAAAGGPTPPETPVPHSHSKPSTSGSTEPIPDGKKGDQLHPINFGMIGEISCKIQERESNSIRQASLLDTKACIEPSACLKSKDSSINGSTDETRTKMVPEEGKCERKLNVPSSKLETSSEAIISNNHILTHPKMEETPSQESIEQLLFCQESCEHFLPKRRRLEFDGNMDSEDTTPEPLSFGESGASRPTETGRKEGFKSCSKSVLAGSVQSEKEGEGPTKKRKHAVSSRTRAQTKFDNVAKRTRTQQKAAAKMAPKELVIVWDHNEHKCPYADCSKSFRKLSLLQSHVKHYHVTPSPPAARNRTSPKQKPAGASKSGHKTSSKSPTPVPSSSSSPRPNTSSVSPPPPPPHKTTKHTKSVLSPRLNPLGGVSAEAMLRRRSQSPAGGYFESLQRDKKQNEIMRLLEQAATKEQKDSKGRPSQETQRKNIDQALKTETKSSRPNNKASVHKKVKQQHSDKPLSVAGPPMKFPLVEIKALPREGLPLSSKGVRAVSTDSFDDLDAKEITGYYVDHVKSPSPGGVGVAVGGADQEKEEEGGEGTDDVVHCICGSQVDEGFMIQCEQCLCWQHGDCVGVSADKPPKKYVCCICTNPPGLRNRLKYKFDGDWFSDGSLPSFPGGPKFPHGAAMHQTHRLSDILFSLRKMVHSAKVKLQAASNPSHPYLKQWTKECAHLSKQEIISYIVASLQPVSYDQEAKSTATSPERRRHSCSSEEEEGREKIVAVKVGRSKTEEQEEEFEKMECCESVGGVSDETKNDEREISVPERESESCGGKKEIEAEGCDENATSQIRPSSALRDTRSPGPKDRRKKIHHSLSKYDDISSLKLDPLPPCSSTVEAAPIMEESSLSSSSRSTAANEAPDPTTLKLAPLPPLSTKDLYEITAAIVKSSLARGTPSSGSTSAESAPKGSHSGAVKSETESSSLEITDEFGVQETSVFALEGSSLGEADVKSKSKTKSQAFTNTTAGTFSTCSPSKLISSANSAFRPVASPSKALTLNKSQSKLDANQSSHIVSPSKSDQPLTNFELKPKLATNPIYSETLSSLESLKSESSMDSVSVEEFSEAFMQADTTNWFQRMLLLDHIEDVQDKIAAWMASVDKQLDDLPSGCGQQLEDMQALMAEVQSTIQELNKIRSALSTT